MKIFTKAIFIAIFATGFFSCVGNTPYVSELNNNQVSIDGYSMEWTGDLRTLDNSTLAYGIKHDNENLYICIKNTSRRFSREMLTKGFYIWFDEKGKSKKRIGIKFPIGLSPQEMRNNMRSENWNNFNFQQIVPTEFEFNISENEKMIMPLMNNGKNIKIEMMSDSDILVYEIKIPFSVILKKNKKNEIKNLGIGFELANFEKNEMITDRSEMGERPSGVGRKSGGRGRRSSGGMQGNRGGSRPMQTKFNVWIKVDISK